MTKIPDYVKLFVYILNCREQKEFWGNTPTIQFLALQSPIWAERRVTTSGIHRMLNRLESHRMMFYHCGTWVINSEFVEKEIAEQRLTQENGIWIVHSVEKSLARRGKNRKTAWRTT